MSKRKIVAVDRDMLEEIVSIKSSEISNPIERCYLCDDPLDLPPPKTLLEAVKMFDTDLKIFNSDTMGLCWQCALNKTQGWIETF